MTENIPLEMCQTMNGMWGFKIADRNYKSVRECVRLIIEAAGKNANLLLNIGPQPDGELPALALDRLKGIGKWMSHYGETIYGTTAADLPKAEWGIALRKDKKIYLHILDNSTSQITLPALKETVKSVYLYDNQTPLKYKKEKNGMTIYLPALTDATDNIVSIETK